MATKTVRTPAPLSVGEGVVGGAPGTVGVLVGIAVGAAVVGVLVGAMVSVGRVGLGVGGLVRRVG